MALAAIVLAAATSAPSPAPVVPDGTYRYETRIGGRTAGRSTIVVRHEGNVVTVRESATLAGASLVSERTIDASSFATISYAVDYLGTHAVVSILGNDATVIQGETTLKISAPPGAPFVVSDNMVAGFAQIPATLHASGEKQLTLACLCGGGFIPVPVKATAARPGVVTISVQDLAATLTFDPRSYALRRFELPAQQLTIALVSYDRQVVPLPQPVVPTPMPLPSANYQSRDVAIAADDGVTLAGTLTVPAAATQPVPGFVFVHGSGCIDRDETIGPNKVFAQLANRLSNDGYAVLRYDKRSCGKSGGTFAARDRLIADARDAIAFLRAQPGVDAKRIFVLGHSEGGELAPSIAIDDGKLRGIVLLAPPALPLDKILLQQIVAQAPPADRAAVEQKESADIAAIAAGKKPGASNAWLRSSFGIDPADLIARVPCPILIVQGGKDIQVLPTDLPRLVDAAKAAHRTVTVVTLDDDDHIFIKLPPNEPSTGGEYFTPATLDPALYAAIEDWLNVEAKLRP
ncbi:MAG TPA: alpha/beta fold hydrolase [Candidatus Binatia bacterium]|nr:alpha/beta fold hydrolase [Candidatus Binatia bacterium]